MMIKTGLTIVCPQCGKTVPVVRFLSKSHAQLGRHRKATGKGYCWYGGFPVSTHDEQKRRLSQ